MFFSYDYMFSKDCDHQIWKTCHTETPIKLKLTLWLLMMAIYAIIVRSYDFNFWVTIFRLI